MSKIQINFDDLQDFAIQLGKAANKCDEALGHINVDLYSLLANIPGVASTNIHELETIFESNLKKYKKNLVKAQHLMRITEAIMSETERKLVRKAREIVQENTWDFTPLRMGDKNILAPQIYGRDEHDSSTKLTIEQVEGLRNYIRQLKDGEIDSNLDAYRAMPEDNTWQGNIYPSNPGVKPEVDHVTKALGKFAFDFLVGDVVTILDSEALTEDKLIAAAMMLPPAKVVKLAAKLKDLEKMKDTIDNLDDVSDKVKDTSKVGVNTVDDVALSHSTKGDFTYNPKTGEVSRMKGGGHGQDNIEFLVQNGIEYNIEKIYPNGVIVGNVPKHKTPSKRSGTGQSWFPETWSNDKIRSAGEYVANLQENIDLLDGVIAYGEYDGVRVGIIKSKGKVGTVFPDGDMQP